MIILCILDGWGINQYQTGNAIAAANTPNWDKLWQKHPASLLHTHGSYVGLPSDQMGNSEVGHMNIGAGRVVMQDLPRIDHLVNNNQLFKVPAYLDMVRSVTSQVKPVCHLMGLFSQGGVHAKSEHMLKLAENLAAQNIQCYLHLFLDGRDTKPQQFLDDLIPLKQFLAAQPLIKIATVTGRYYAMDRDQRWERTELAAQAILTAESKQKFEGLADLTAKIQASYDSGKNDEFIEPMICASYSGVKDRDALLMTNFRADRARQIMHRLCNPDHDVNNQHQLPKWSAKLNMTSYEDRLKAYVDILLPKQALDDTIGEVIAKAGKKQLRLAETEKYPHVTFFFNGGREDSFPNEERILVPSPKVKTYDLQPEMSAYELTAKLNDAISSKQFDFIIVNYANADMVGHTGIWDAALQAVTVIDECLGQVMQACTKNDAHLFITADHGNIEDMYADDSGTQPKTSHSHLPVPFVYYGNDRIKLANGRLCDIAPSLLKFAGITVPESMTGEDLINHA